jgi:hypothetical protein
LCSTSRKKELLDELVELRVATIRSGFSSHPSDLVPGAIVLAWKMGGGWSRSNGNVSGRTRDKNRCSLARRQSGR